MRFQTNTQDLVAKTDDHVEQFVLAHGALAFVRAGFSQYDEDQFDRRGDDLLGSGDIIDLGYDYVVPECVVGGVFVRAVRAAYTSVCGIRYGWSKWLCGLP